MDSTVTMTGYVGTEISCKTSKQGTPWTTFRLACTPRSKRGGEWVDEPTIWMTVTAYRQLAQNLAASVHKGDPVIVTGRIRLDHWVGKDGIPHNEKILEARCVGLDLAFGTCKFQRTSAPTVPLETPPAHDSAIVAPMHCTDVIERRVS
ncbi:MAG: single-stranded DNA-binding protein [Propionibacteriaceae bacterium]